MTKSKAKSSIKPYIISIIIILAFYFLLIYKKIKQNKIKKKIFSKLQKKIQFIKLRKLSLIIKQIKDFSENFKIMKVK